jgi:hypothetical protein
VKPLHATGGTTMFKQLFPQRVYNTYRGFKLALGFFALLVLMMVGFSGGSNLCEVEVPLTAGEF